MMHEIMTGTGTGTAPPPDPDPILAADPVGSEIDTADGPWGLATATFDASRRYRFRLSRIWHPDRPRICFVMLNPSTADALVLDPTVRRCAGFAHDWGAGAFEVTNVFALRSTDPAGLKRVGDPVGNGNDEAIVAAALAADAVICAWGTRANHLGRHRAILEVLDGAGIVPLALRLTKAGFPGHPLYVPRSARPFRFA
jgi:hypothetical protein